MKTSVTQQVLKARRCGVPVLALNTPDPAQAIREISEALLAEDQKLMEQEAGIAASVILQWDFVQGLGPLSKTAGDFLGTLGETDDTQFNPMGALITAGKLPARGVLFIHQAHRWLSSQSLLGYCQAVWNLRDKYKSTERMLVLVGKSIRLPMELSDDVVLLDEPLPDAEQLGRIVRRVHHDAGLEPEDSQVAQATEAVRGLSAFAAEQVTAMSLTKSGLKLDSLWERKRQQIEQTPGLKVFRDGERFDDIGGVEIIKDFLRKIMQGRSRPNAVVFIDEIEKMLSGMGDTSGVSQDQLGCLLSYMQDHRAAGMIFVGPPGAAKSAIAKAAGNEGGVPTIQLDLGAAKGSLVGQSEQQLREALKVVTAVSNGKSLWIATCNKIADLPPELRRRFTLGTFFFDLPDAAERQVIWDIYLSAYSLQSKASSLNDEGWTGAEIRQCCEIAWRLDCPLDEAARFVVPVSRSAADQIRRLREQAHGRFLSASTPGVYQFEESAQTAPNETARRKVQL